MLLGPGATGFSACAYCCWMPASICLLAAAAKLRPVQSMACTVSILDRCHENCNLDSLSCCSTLSLSIFLHWKFKSG